MVSVREPILHSVPILDLRPTQLTVGMREVNAKRSAWKMRAADPAGAGEFLGKHMIPVIRGPKDHHYIIDHHHLCRALHDEEVEKVAVTIVADLHRLDHDAFWFVLDNRNWSHPYDAGGTRREHADIPKSVEGLVDDPFRSLAGELRRMGGYAKDTTPFSEFLWADFLRRRLKQSDVAADFEQALAQAMKLARDEEADYLPGWCGPVEQ